MSKHQNDRSSRYAQAGTGAMAAGLLILSAQAYAAETESGANKTDTLEEVVITAMRKSLKSAQDIKKNAAEVVDSITAVDIGALPDRSVSEALQRIPGVTLQRTNENRDPARMAAEGGGIFIRGLSWVRSETNGRDVFSANNGRDLSFEDVSADLLAGVDVYKNPTADHIEGGIGGIVDLRTRKPFDSEKRLLAGSVDYNYADLLKEGFKSGNVLYSDSWDTGAGRFGLLAAISIGNIGNQTDSIQTGRYVAHTLSASEATATGLAAGSTVYLPNSWGYRSIDWRQKRQSADLALQWAPTDKLTLTLQALAAQADPKDIEHTVGDGSGISLNNIDSTYKFAPNGVLESGTASGVQLGGDTRYGQSHKITKDFSLNMDYRASDHWTVTSDLQFVTSHADVLSLTAFDQLSTASPEQLAFNLGSDDPTMHVIADPAYLKDPANYWWAAAMDHVEKNDAHSYAGRVDTEYLFDDNSWLKSLRLGLRLTEKQAITRQTGWNWNLLSNQFWGNGGGAIDYLNSGSTPASASSFNSYSNFMRGSVANPGGFWLPSDSLVNQGRAYAYSILQATETSGWGWSPVSTDWGNTTLNADNGNRGINNQHERTTAFYTTLNFAHDSFIGPMDGNLGVRVVHTAVDAVATPGAQATSGTALICTSADPTQCAYYNSVTAFLAAFGEGSVTSANAYNDVLPTLNVRFHLTDALQLRFGAGKAMSRPTFSQMQGSTALSVNTLTVTNTDGTVYPVGDPSKGVNGNGLTGTQGNPTLKPTRATQFDTSLEWYFAPAGSLTGAVFYKDITNYIFPGQVHETYTAGGQTLAFDVTRNINGAHGTVKGFEVAYQQFYDMLPGPLSGIGVQANYTFVDSSGGKNPAVNVLDVNQVAGSQDTSLPLEGLSRNSYNLALLYEKYNISARLAYNWRQMYLLTTSAANINQPVWMENYGQLDGSVFYSFSEHVKVGVQVTNLANSRTYLDVGGAVLHPRYSWTDTDRRIAIALRVNL